MKKITFLLFFVTCAFFSNAQTTVLSDNFDDLTTGTFGNAGSVMLSTTGLTVTDTRTGWDLANSLKVNFGVGTIKMGTGSELGYIKTSALNLAGTFTVNFSATAWSGDATTIDVQLNGTTIQTVTLANAVITDKASMGSFLVQGTGTGSDVICFIAKQATKNRFLLDDVVILTEKMISGISNPSANLFSAIVSGKNLLVRNVADGSTVEIFNALGAKVQSSELVNSSVGINNLTKGMYIVRVGKNAQKIML